MKKGVFAVSCMLMICASYAQIFKWTDSQGIVHFSDTPHQGAQKVKIPEAQSFSPPVTPKNDVNDDLLAKKANEEHKYSKVAITQPLNESTIRNNQGYVVVAVELDPPLFEGDMVQIVFDGAPMGDPQEKLLFQLNGIYRGEHKIAAQVLNAAGEIITTSNSITIFMHRPRVNMVHGAKGGANAGGN